MNRLSLALRARFAVICAAALLASARAADKPPPPGPEADKLTLARIVVEGARANWGAIRAFRCKYLMREGLASSQDAAFQGQITIREECNIEWLVDGERECFLFRAADAKVRDAIKAQLESGGPPGPRRVSAGPSSEFFLSNGPEQLKYAPVVSSASLFTPDNPAGNLDNLPPGAEGVGPGDKRSVVGEMFKRILDGSARLIGKERFRGADVYSMEMAEGPPADPLTTVCSFDPARGYLPVRQVHKEARQVIEVVITDAKEVVPGVWFPMRSVTILGTSKSSKLSAREYRVTEFEPGPPPDSAFQVKLPAGISVVDRRDARTAFVLREDETVGLADLPKLLERAALARDKRLADNPPKGFGPGLWTVLVLALAAALIVFVVVVRYSRRMKLPARGSGA